MTRRGNTLVSTLLGLAVMAMVGLCFVPYSLQSCGHRGSLVDQWFPNWRPHTCAGQEVHADLWDLFDFIRGYQEQHGQLEDNLFAMVPWRALRKSDERFHFAYTRTAHDWQISVAKTAELPGWYMVTSNGEVHFSEKGLATRQDAELEP